MQPPAYRNFDLAVTREGRGYVARVLDSPAGEAEHPFDWPFDDRDIELLVLTAGRTRTGVRRIGSPESDRARTFGRRLADTVLGGDVETCLLRSLDAVERDGANLRIRLRLTDVPELHDVPWEFLWADELGRFLVVSMETPLVRYLDLPRTARPLQVTPPLHVLSLVALPDGVEELAADREAANLAEALAALVAAGQVELDQLPDGTANTLQERLRRRDVHVLHVVGHGGFDPRTGEGVLVLEDEAGRPRLVTADELGTILHDHRPLRLVVLNACEGARTGPRDPWAGVAQALVRQGIPAVVAMQFEITDEAAVTFSRALYRAIADAYPVDAAVSEGRKALFAAGNDVEWATPVLFMRTPDGRVFDVAAAGPTTPDVTATATSDPTAEPATSGSATAGDGDPPPVAAPTAHGPQARPSEEGADAPGSAPQGPGARTRRRRAGAIVAALAVVVVVAGGLVWLAGRGSGPTDPGAGEAVRIQSACPGAELDGQLGPARRDDRLVRVPVHLEDVSSGGDGYTLNNVDAVRDQDGSEVVFDWPDMEEGLTVQPDATVDTQFTVTPGATSLASITVELNLECESLTTTPLAVPPG